MVFIGSGSPTRKKENIVKKKEIHVAHPNEYADGPSDTSLALFLRPMLLALALSPPAEGGVVDDGNDDVDFSMIKTSRRKAMNASTSCCVLIAPRLARTTLERGEKRSKALV